MIIFVYGTLKRGNFLSYCLEQAEFLGEARTVREEFRMFCNGHYPLVTSCERGYCISGELYRVNADSLALLDRVENGYQRCAARFLCAGVEVAGELYIAPYGDDLLTYREVTNGEWFPPRMGRVGKNTFQNGQNNS